MSEVVPDTHQEFWRPPVATHSVSPSPVLATTSISVGSCAVCHTEFMPSSRFCYLCGATRGTQVGGKSWAWKGHFGFLRVFGFQHIKQGIGLRLPSLAGFLVGIGCLIAALAVSWVVKAQTTAEFQAVQLLRIEWLLGSVAAFLAGILLKRSEPAE